MRKNKGPKRVLCLRFSAFGDVAIAAITLRCAATENPDIQFYMAGPERMRPLFEGCHGVEALDNLHYVAVNKKQGVFAIYKQLRAVKPTHVADLHSVLRTFLLRTLFFLSGKRVAFLRKGRIARKRLIRRKTEHNHLQPLTPIHERYAKVLCRLGIVMKPQKREVSLRHNGCVGVAPFAKHAGKQWPLERTEEIVKWLSAEKVQVFLFGWGPEEEAVMQRWAQTYPGVQCASNTSFEKELALMARLDWMLTMDSANMHFASFMKTAVASIWCATHPAAGFMGFGQLPESALQKHLPCRPCSIFGAAPCYKGTYACYPSVEEVKRQLASFLFIKQ